MLAPALLSGHELGTIRVSVRFQKDGTYIVDAIVDRQHLPPGFGAAGTPTSKRFEPVENLTPELEKRIGPLIADAVNGATITFDGKPVFPPVALVLPEGGAAAVPDAGEITIRFKGEIPGGAKTFHWQNAGTPGANILTHPERRRRGGLRVMGRGEREERPVPAQVRDRADDATRRSIADVPGARFHAHPPEGHRPHPVRAGDLSPEPPREAHPPQVTAFTIAHTITLALTIYGVVSLRPAIVEPMIALSIVYVAVENVVTSKLRPGASRSCSGSASCTGWASPASCRSSASRAPSS